MKTFKNTMMVLGISAMAVVSAPALAADAPAAPAAAPAPAATGLTFGIVDMNKVMQTTDAAKDIFSQLDGKRKEYLAQISKQEDSLRALQQELDKQKGTLSKEALEVKRKAFEEKYQQWQKLAQNRKDVLDRAFESAMNKLREKAAEIVAAAAKQKHYSAVFTQNAVMMSTPDLDLTGGVIEEMNKTVKNIPVDWAAASDEAASAGKKK
jgi:outer membrane protein